MNRLRTCLVLLGAAACPACRQEAAGPVAIQPGDVAAPPLEIRFKPFSWSFVPDATDDEPSCGVPDGRPAVYDPATGVFHIHFKDRDIRRSAFEVTKVADGFPRPVVFRLTGVPLAYGCLGFPLALTVGENRYALIDVGHDSCDAYAHFDRTQFRVERNDDVVTVAFTEKGQALLRPGAEVSFSVDTGW